MQTGTPQIRESRVNLHARQINGWHLAGLKEIKVPPAKGQKGPGKAGKA
jgi:hypothetical protein